MRFLPSWFGVASMACGAALAATAPLPQPGMAAEPLDAAAVRRLFAAPPVEYSSVPFWVWNDLLDEDQIRTSLRDLASQGLKQAMVHPRPGLMTPYLSADWFRLWRAALDEAGKLGMKLWIYDENSYPSGFAGGEVPEAMPAAQGQGIAFEETKAAPAWKDNMLAVYGVEGDAVTNVTAAVQAGEKLPAGRYVSVKRVLANSGPWYGNRTYVNLLTPGVTQKFLDVTFEPYRRELGAALGTQVPGIFTDEPHIRPAGELPWSDELATLFQQRWHYSLLDQLPALTLEVGDWRRVRYHYYRLLNELFVERWARPYYEASEKLGLESTGHYWEHEWPNCRTVPDNMTMASWQHRPGIDILMNEYADGPNAQFGNARAVREIASLANQLGRARTLCEIYGAGGWDLRFEDMKRIGDWLQVLGCNTFVEHVSYVSLRGGRKRDHPQSFSYHEPWWQDYHHLVAYYARLSAALAQGRQVNRVLLLEPTTTAWMYNAGRGQGPRLEPLGRSFQQTVNVFEAAQLGYDLGCENVLTRVGSVVERQLVIGAAAYEVVVLPAANENLDGTTCALLEKFLVAGGTVVSLAPEPPARIDGAIDPRGRALAAHSGWKTMGEAELVRWLAEREAATFAVRRAPDDRGLLFHYRRQLPDGELIFLVNTSHQHASAGTLRGLARRIERWDAASGDIVEYASLPAGDYGRETDFLLPPAGSLLLYLDRSTAPAGAAIAHRAAMRTLTPLAAPEVVRAEPNVLTLDFVDVAVGREKRENLYTYQAAQFVFQQNGLKANPWESAVQFRDELLQRRFAPDSGFEASYRFTIEGAVPARLDIVIERADLISITCNGEAVAPTPGKWWLDRAFHVIPLQSVARVGENVVAVRAQPLQHQHELEPAYLRGDFRLRPAKEGFVVVPDAPLGLGAWRDQGHPFYATGVIYREKFDVPAPLAGRYLVALSSWYGSVARVRVNGAEAGIIAWAPWTCDVTPHLRPGVNTVEVQVVGTLKNTLGPHHGNPPLGRAWPSNFRVAPKNGRAGGSDYSTVAYGLFAPFTLKQEL